ncbi:MAG: NAD(P)-dependent oxidoreductase [Myxococcota bacterium]
MSLNGKVVITGASGFIGSWLRDVLLDRGVDVIAIRRKDSPEPKRGRSVVADYADQASLVSLFKNERPSYLLHVAGATAGIDYPDFHRGNVVPTQNLVEAALTSGVPLNRFVYMSSLTSYGPATKERPLVETDPRKPIEHYGKSKLAAEEVVEAIGDRLPWTILRPSGVYGPRNTEFLKLFELLGSGWNLFYDNAERVMSLVYVDDCVDATLAAATSDRTIGKGYFLSDDQPINWEQLAAVIMEATGRKATRLNLPGFFLSPVAIGGELMARVRGKPSLFNQQKALMARQDAWTCSSAAARADFGFAPKVMAKEGAARSWAWYLENGWIK